MVDGFSKFVWLFPLRDMTVRAVVNTLARYIVGKYGVPEAIISDNAAIFRSKMLKDCSFKLGVKHIITSPYYPQPSLVERFNRNLKAALVAFHHDQQNSWDQNLHIFQNGFNSAWHEATKSTPAKLFLGRELNHPLQL
jgi:transposase InsO family protein